MKAVNMDLAYGLNQDYVELIQTRAWMQTPEQRLLFAILERGARDYLGNQKSEREAAEEWFFSEENTSDPCEPFCFSWVCEHLEIDPEEFRARLLNSFASLPRVHPTSEEPTQLPGSRMGERFSAHHQVCVACAA